MQSCLYKVKYNKRGGVANEMKQHKVKKNSIEREIERVREVDIPDSDCKASQTRLAYFNLLTMR